MLQIVKLEIECTTLELSSWASPDIIEVWLRRPPLGLPCKHCWILVNKYKGRFSLYNSEVAFYFYKPLLLFLLPRHHYDFGFAGGLTPKRSCKSPLLAVMLSSFSFVRLLLSLVEISWLVSPFIILCPSLFLWLSPISKSLTAYLVLNIHLPNHLSSFVGSFLVLCIISQRRFFLLHFLLPHSYY